MNEIRGEFRKQMDEWREEKEELKRSIEKMRVRIEKLEMGRSADKGGDSKGGERRIRSIGKNSEIREETRNRREGGKKEECDNKRCGG